MGYRSLRECVDDLERHGRLVRLETPVDPRLEAAEIHRRVYASGGPAVLFTQLKGCRFPAVSNLFGTIERARFMFRDTWEDVRRLIELRVDPARLQANATRYWRVPFAGLRMFPRRTKRGPVDAHVCSIRDLPGIVSWPRDGGAFITLPQVYSEHPRKDFTGDRANLGMYRVQLSGNEYAEDEVGLHYQIHRSIGVHHAAALARGESLPVNIFVGGTPAMTLAAVMPLPEGLSELKFAGALAGHRIPMVRRNGLAYYGDADFCLRGAIAPNARKPEGPFGDHLGYYSLQHDFPVLQTRHVSHRDGAIWPFTVVGRPPQEDTTFGHLIHELTGPIIPSVLPGVREVNAVDAAGVHPLLLAIGCERYTPDQPLGRPQELLTQANAILGQGQMSLAKYLWIANHGDDQHLSANRIPEFFSHMLRRVDWRRDLHFQTCTTIDTLDYSGDAINQGSKLVIAAAGPPIRELPRTSSAQLRLPEGFGPARVAQPGILAVQAPPCRQANDGCAERFCRRFTAADRINQFPLIVLVDDSDFAARSLDNLLWVTFTRSNPAADVHGIDSETRQRHWGCRGALVIDARTKPHHAPALEVDPEISARVDALAARGGPLAKYL
ncbi:MAG: UbiD family decarboxylase [Planctomycetales bacterium]|nr:UbiD family decarboxylase [Planctomycetales bacterium]